MKYADLQATARLPAPLPASRRRGRSRSPLGAMGATVLIPYLTGRAIDSIRAHHRHELIIWAIAIVRRRPGAAGAERGAAAGRRPRVARRRGRPAQPALRRAPALELAFFDRQQTGQLMSRATVDLQSVRFFLGYGLIFIAQSLLTIALAAIAMFVLQPRAGGALAGAGAVRGADRVALRPALAARAPGGPAADRRADRRGRGERLGRARRQGVRPGGAPARPLRALGRRACSTSRCTRPGSRRATRR